MTLPPVDLRVGDCQELDRILGERIYEFNAKATGYHDGESFACVQRDESGAMIAGVSGYTWGGCCQVSYLWVAEEHRGHGLGRALLQAAERHARNQGCVIALLSSHDFQAPAFYRRLGYHEQASVRDHPVGHSNIIYSKRLTGTDDR